MDNLFAGDSLLMDGNSDLPLLPLPLLPLPDDCILPPRPVAGSSPTDSDTQFPDSMPADLSREGPFEVLPGASVVGVVSLPGCPYRMTSYDRDCRRRSGIQITATPSTILGICWGAQIGASVISTSGTLGSNNGA